jgi:peptidoglycan/xylan/chitin deacetylase (PgdA/CDA1 family)
MRNLAVVATLLATSCAMEVGDPADLDTEHDEDEEAQLYTDAYEELQGDDTLLLDHPDALDDLLISDGGREPEVSTIAATGCSGVVTPDQGGFNKRIALTFDDGPNPATTPKVIAILKKHNVPATFFNNGARYSTTTAKNLAKQIAADPLFILANHSQNHLDLAHQTATKVASEIDRTTALIRAAGETPRYFRFPYGSSTCATAKQARNRGYIITGWNIDSADWCYASGGGTCSKSTFAYVPDSMRSNMLAYVRSQAKAKNGGIILMHDIHANTANHLEQIITTLKADGFTFVRLSNKTVFPKLNGG